MTAELTRHLITCTHSKEANKQQVCVCRLNLITWFMLVMIFLCFADGKARDKVKQVNQPRSETGVLTPVKEDEYQVDTCPPPFTVWFGGTARLCLLLACACCIFVQQSGQSSDFSMQAAAPLALYTPVFCPALVYGAKGNVPQVESNKQDDSCFGGKAICEGYSALPAIMLKANFVWTAQLALVACFALRRCLFPDVVISGAAISATS